MVHTLVIGTTHFLRKADLLDGNKVSLDRVKKLWYSLPGLGKGS